MLALTFKSLTSTWSRYTISKTCPYVVEAYIVMHPLLTCLFQLMFSVPPLIHKQSCQIAVASAVHVGNALAHHLIDV